MVKKITTPITAKQLETLEQGDNVLISGDIYTARDAAHKRMIEALEQGGQLPFEINGAVIYYAGPAPTPPGKVIGSCGPTTSGRMDAYTPVLIELGLGGMIGKGERSEQVVQAIRHHGSVYFGAIGGSGALISKCVTDVTPVAYEDLGAEAIVKITVEDFPVIVLIR